MDVGVVLALVLIVGYLVAIAAVVAGTVDALVQPAAAWQRAGMRRHRWSWQALGVFVIPLGLVYTGWYVVRIRPRLLAAQRDLAVESMQARPARRARSGPPADAVTMRQPWSVAALGLLPLVPFLVLVTTDHSGYRGSTWDVVGAYVAIGVALILLTRLAFGLVLRPDGVVVRGLTRRRVAWSDVTAFTEERQLYVRYVRLWRSDGSSRRLRAPTTQFGLGRRHFEHDLDVLERWYDAYAGTAD